MGKSWSKKKSIIMVMLIIAVGLLMSWFTTKLAHYNTFEECYLALVGPQEKLFVLDGTDSKLVSYRNQDQNCLTAFLNKDGQWYGGSILTSNTVVYSKNGITCSLFVVKKSVDCYIEVATTSLNPEDNIQTVEDNLNTRFMKIVYSTPGITCFYARLPNEIAEYELYVDGQTISEAEFYPSWSERIAKPAA